MQRCATLVVIALLSLGGVCAADQRPISSRIVRLPWDSHVLAAVGYSKRLHALELEFISSAPFIVTAMSHPQGTAIFSALLPRPNSTMRMCAGIFRRSMSNRHELNVRSHQGRKTGHLFRDARDSGWSGSEGISARPYGN